MIPSPKVLLPLLLGVIFSCGVYAESDKHTVADEYVLEVNGQKGQAISIKAARENWEQKRFSKMKDEKVNLKTAEQDELSKRRSSKIVFPKPALQKRSDAIDFLKLPATAAGPSVVNFKKKDGHDSLKLPASSAGSRVIPLKKSDARNFSEINWLALLEPLADLLLPSAAEAATLYGNIAIDGNLSDWTINERINLPLDKPPYLAIGTELYAKYVGGTTPVYLFGIKAPGVVIGANTTLWLNTDQNPASGYQIWGAYGGAEFSVNVYTDGVPHLYNAAFGWVAGLEYAYSADKTTLEFVVPATSIVLSVPQAIDVLGDINDTSYFPEFYSSGNQYTVPGVAEVLPVRTDLSKRVGIVYSDTSKNNFYNEKAYSQLFMALQHQAMMAGIGFDLLTETDLTNLNKLVNYDALIFPYASNIPNSLRSQVRKNLFTAIYKFGVGIITADNFMTNDELNAAIPGDSYQIMKQLLGITRVDGAGPVTLDLAAADVTHPAMKGYAANESILSSQALNAYKSTWTSYYQAITGQTVSILANQTISGVGTKPGVIASTTGGRNVHFATAGLMADGPLVWQALQWAVYGTQTPVALNMGRNNNLFISRNDMDQSQQYGNAYYDDMGNVDVPLLYYLKQWKSLYNFVGSYYINIGNNPPDQQTVWLSTPTPKVCNVTSSSYSAICDSQPLYQQYVALSNEIGTHSWTHPEDTNLLTATQLEFEFNQSMNQIVANLNSTWQNQPARGAAVPGMPEGLATAEGILQYLDYLSGGASLIGAGYPSAIGYLTPADTKVYFSPNMSFDFTMVDFGVPSGNPPVPVRLTAAQAEQYWANEYDRLMKHASQPIVHWPWHDYGPTSATTAASGQGYTVAMFENTIKKAFNNGAEFTTLADVAQRIATFKNAKLTVAQNGSQYTATVAATNVGKFSLGLNLPAGQKIQRVNNWYAYNDNKVFLDDDGGTFVVQTGTTADVVTHITEMPIRSKLISLTGDGVNLNLGFEGEGTVKVLLKDLGSKFQFTSDGGVVTSSSNTASIKFATFGVHTVAIKLMPVTAYKNASYGGASQAFDVGTYIAPAGLSVVGDNAITSFRVATGYSVKACENANATGICKTYTANIANIATLLSNLDNKISYLKVSKP